MTYGRFSVVWINVIAALAVGACVALAGSTVAAAPRQQWSVWLVFAFLAGFSTVSGQMAWVDERREGGAAYVLVAGLVLMAAGLGWLSFGVVRWLL